VTSGPPPGFAAATSTKVSDAIVTRGLETAAVTVGSAEKRLETDADLGISELETPRWLAPIRDIQGRDEVRVIVAEAELAIAADRSRRRSGDQVGWDDLLSAAHELQRLGMPPREIHTVLVTHDLDVVRRLMELHRERLQERLADEVAAVAGIEASLSEAIRTRTRARSAKTLVRRRRDQEPDQVGA
jgi:hypothetical protein